MSLNTCQTLLDTAGVDIYSRNPFRLLGLPVDAKNRRIRRQEKELIDAIEMGELAEEYPKGLCPDPLPSREEISQAARDLSDPKKRFVYEFFWFWPIEWGNGQPDEALQLFIDGKWNEAQAAWKLESTVPGMSGLVSQHNLALLGHMGAIESEQRILAAQQPAELTKEQRNKLNQYWEYSFNYWEPLHRNDAFWSLLVDRVRNLGEHRLTTGFVRSFTTSLPVALDNINADLAVDFCKRGIYSRARDHVRIMKATNEGDDDVDASIRRVTGPLHKRIDDAIETATEHLAANRTTGKERCVELFNTARSTLNVLGVLLGVESSEFAETCDRVAESMLQCQVVYAKETEDWRTCIPLLEVAIKVARGRETRTRLEETLEIIRSNARQHTCWFCGKRPKEDAPSIKVKMERKIYWRDVRRDPHKYPEVVQKMWEGLLKTHPLRQEDSAMFYVLFGRISDIQERVQRLSSSIPDSTEIMTRWLETTVPRCSSCQDWHDSGEEDARIQPFHYYKLWPGVLEAKKEGLRETSVTGKPPAWWRWQSTARATSSASSNERLVAAWALVFLAFLFTLPIFPYSGWIGLILWLASAGCHPDRDSKFSDLDNNLSYIFMIAITFVALVIRALVGILV